MTIDTFASQLFEESKRFREKHLESQHVNAYLHAALLLGMCSLEAHVNSICDEFALTKDLTAHEQALLTEKSVDLKDGRFVIGKNIKFYRLEDRILFLCSRFSVSPIDKNSAAWHSFRQAVELRNQLVHPKDAMTIKSTDLDRALNAVLEILNVIFLALYKTGHPSFNRQLHSNLNF